jgi:hypothetical protein
VKEGFPEAVGVRKVVFNLILVVGVTSFVAADLYLCFRAQDKSFAAFHTIRSFSHRGS